MRVASVWLLTVCLVFVAGANKDKKKNQDDFLMLPDDAEAAAMLKATLAKLQAGEGRESGQKEETKEERKKRLMEMEERARKEREMYGGGEDIEETNRLMEKATELMEERERERKKKEKGEKEVETSFQWHSMAEVRQLQAERRTMVIVRVDPIDAKGMERQTMMMAEELRARGVEGVVFVKRTPPVDDDTAWLQREGVSVLAEVVVVEGEEGKKAKEYKGDGTFTDLLNWLLPELASSIERPKRLRSVEDVEKFMAAYPVSVIASVPAGQDSMEMFVRKLANRHTYLHYGLIYPADSVKYGALQLVPFGIYFREDHYIQPVDVKKLQAMDDFTRDTALKKATRLLVSRFPDDAAEMFKQGVDRIAFVFGYYRSGERLMKQTPPYLLRLAREMSGRVVVAFVDSDDERMDGMRAMFGVKSTPTVRVFDHSTEAQFWPQKREKAMKEEEIEQFVKDAAAGKIARHRRVEEMEEKNEGSRVERVNGDGFRRTAFNPSLDVVVLFHTTWCPHSKRFAEVYKMAAEKGIGKVKFTAIDVEKNDVDQDLKNKIRVFPTVILFKKNGNTEVVYNGRRTVAALLDWLEAETEERKKEEKKESKKRGLEEENEEEATLREMIKDDHEQKYRMKDLKVDPLKAEGGKMKRSREMQETVDDVLAKRVLEKLNVDKATIVESMNARAKMREEEEEEEKRKKKGKNTVDKKESTVGGKKTTVTIDPKDLEKKKEVKTEL